MIKRNYNHTIAACYVSYVTQAIVNNFVPLLFLTFRKSYGISLEKVTLLVVLNFGIQLIVDVLSAKFIDKIGYRISVVMAHICTTIGIAGLSVFPLLFLEPYYGLLLAILFYSVGGGLIEVLISPIVEACPTEKKSAAMSLLHSFYCWGHVLVILVSTLFFQLFGIEKWGLLAIFWAIIPLLNTFYFTKVPIVHLTESGRGMRIRQLFSVKMFWVFLVLMICAGAAEQAMSQWASAFAEDGLGISKTLGDLAGPCFFAVMMGLSRTVYAKFSERLPLIPFMMGSTCLCILSYMLAVFFPLPLIALLGCGLCGLSVGILWPGTFSIASSKYPAGGTAMFALMAMGGDIGCGLGPATVGVIADLWNGNLKMGLLAAVIFPVILTLGLNICKRKEIKIV